MIGVGCTLDSPAGQFSQRASSRERNIIRREGIISRLQFGQEPALLSMDNGRDTFLPATTGYFCR